MTTETEDGREFYTIRTSDVNKASIEAFDRTWQTSNFIGCIMEQDVGKHIYRELTDACDSYILQVESTKQFMKRTRLDGTARIDMQECPLCEETFDANDIEHDQDVRFGNIRSPDKGPICCDCQNQLIILADGTEILIEKVLDYYTYPVVEDSEGNEFLLMRDCDQGEELAAKYIDDLAKNDPEEFCCLIGHENLVKIVTGNLDREQFLEEWAGEEFGNRHYEDQEVVLCGASIVEELGFTPTVKFDQES